MFFEKIFTPGLFLNTYLIGNTQSKTCVIVDPPRQTEACLIAAQNASFTITHILETHVHADFVSGAVQLKHELGGKPKIYASKMGGKEWIPSYADVLVNDGDLFHLDHIKFQAVHTPGHTPEHLIWVCYDEKRSSTSPWFALTGDLIFIGGVTRADLLGQDKQDELSFLLYKSLFVKIKNLPDHLEIFPAHSQGSLCGKFYGSKPSSTLGYERLCNPYLQPEKSREWTQKITKEFSSSPAHFKNLKKINVEGPKLLDQLTTIALEGSLEEIDWQELFVIDTRSPLKFSECHLKNSLNIPLHDRFAEWMSWLAPEEKTIAIILEDHYQSQLFIQPLRLIGFDQPIVTIPFPNQSLNQIQKDSYSSVSPQDALEKNYLILDVRSPKEQQQEKVANSLLIELIELEKKFSEIPLNQPVAILCRTGIRASIAASILRKLGHEKAFPIVGGLESWKQANLPIV